MIQAAIFDLGGTLLEFNPQKLPWLEWERIGLVHVHTFLTAQGHVLDFDQLATIFSSALPERWELAAKGVKNLKLGDMLHESCAACGVTLTGDEIGEAIAELWQSCEDAAALPLRCSAGRKRVETVLGPFP